MSINNRVWKRFFLFCFGLTIAATFCMKWMESDFYSGSEKFTILGLEWFYSSEKLVTILTSVVEPARTALNYHLHFDFIFMAGIYPCIAALAMIASARFKSKLWKWIFIILALLQPLAWVLDIIENMYILKWLDHPTVGNSFEQYHLVVAAKWLLALAGAFVSILALIFKRSIRK